MDSEGSLPHVQNPTSGLYPEPGESSPQPNTLFFDTF
jgi:hypothetical protein